MKPFEIFRTGRHTPMAGAPLQFAEGDLAATAVAYDPSKHHAPIVVGHPRQDAPAYGWVDGLDISGDRLVAKPARVDPEFAELVRQGRFAKVSASFYLPDAPGNPTPGTYYLRHVGFLGAQPPAVKGLKPIEFADDEAGTIEFSDWPQAYATGITARLFRSLREWLISSSSIDQANQTLPDWDIEALSRASADAMAAETQPVPAFSEPTTAIKDTPMTDTTAADAAELERRAADLASREAAFAERERADRAAADKSFVTGVVEAGRLPIGLAATATALFAELGSDTISFADGGDDKQTTPREAFRTLLEQLPVPVTTKEVAGGDVKQVDFSDPLTVATAITTEIETAKAKGETITSAEALSRLQKGAAS